MTNGNFARLLGPAALVFLLSILAGCAGPARHQEMVVAPSTITSKPVGIFASEVFVSEVVGGQKTNPLWTSEIDDDNFKKALVNSLRQHGFHNDSKADSKYHLTAKLLGVSQPAFGLSFTVSMHVNYLVLDSETDESVLLKTITSEYTASMGEAFIAIKRLRLANQGAARENIKLLIAALSDYERPIALK